MSLLLLTYHMTYKVTTDQKPFQFMYDQEATVSIKVMVPSLRIAIENRFGDMESLREQLYALNKLDDGPVGNEGSSTISRVTA